MKLCVTITKYFFKCYSKGRRLGNVKFFGGGGNEQGFLLLNRIDNFIHPSHSSIALVEQISSFLVVYIFAKEIMFTEILCRWKKCSYFYQINCTGIYVKFSSLFEQWPKVILHSNFPIIEFMESLDDDDFSTCRQTVHVCKIYVKFLHHGFFFFLKKSGFCLIQFFAEANVMYIPHDSPLVLLVPTSWQLALQLVTSPHASAEVGLGSDLNRQSPGQNMDALPLCG